jgi:pantoate--beta-alanine ligase
MEIFTTKAAIERALNNAGGAKKTIGFVPTMGALHAGHLSLIEQAKEFADEVVCSVFVNPSQFTDPKDLEQYPRTIEADIQMLKEVKCDILFYPDVTEIYAGDETWHLELGELEYLLEGKFRPGHYQGVAQVVFKLFNIVKPRFAFFGQKDYQQFLAITKMVNLLNLPVKLIMCPIKREPDGLAMSSRNIHLSPADHEHALILSKTLNWVKDNFNRDDIPGLQRKAETMTGDAPGIELEYFEIADGDTLHRATNQSKNIVALVAAKVGKTRLIDNVLLVHGR